MAFDLDPDFDDGFDKDKAKQDAEDAAAGGAGSKYVIEPGKSARLQRWDVFIALVLMYVAVVTPFASVFNVQYVLWVFWGALIAFYLSVRAMRYTNHNIGRRGGSFMRFPHTKLLVMLPSEPGRALVPGYLDVEPEAAALPFAASLVKLPNNTLGSYGMYLEAFRTTRGHFD